MARPTFRHRGLFWLHAPKSWSGTFPILKLFQGTPENLGEMVSHTFYVHEQRNKVKKVFEVSFKITVEAVSLMLHGQNSFNEVFKKKQTAVNCCLETWSIAAVLAWLHRTILCWKCARPNISEYCLSGHVRLIRHQ